MLNRTSRFNTVLFHAIVLAFVCLPYCINLGRSSIWDANEAFYAETPREMITRSDYLAPHFNFQPRAQKPPLTYWAVLISYKLFGIGEFAVRFPSALAAIGTILFSYALARLLHGNSAALFSAIITGTTARVFILARRLPIDIILLFFLTGTLYFIVRALQKTEKRSWIAAYIFSSLGFLTKGPIAIVVPAFAYVFCLLWVERRGGFIKAFLARIREAHPLLGAAVFAGIAVPWYLLIYRAHGWLYISPFFLRDNFGRFAAESLGPARGPFYYVSVFISDFFPWSLLFIAAVCVAWLQRKSQPRGQAAHALPLIWCALIFLFFSLSRNKQEYYIAPMYPAAAVFAAGIFARIAASKETAPIPEGQIGPSGKKLWNWIFALLAVMLLLLAAFLPYVLTSFMPGIAPVLHYGPSLVLLGGVLLLIWSIRSGKQSLSFSAVAASLWAMYLICALWYLPALESYRPVKDFCRIIESAWSPGDEAGYFGTALPSMVYYLRRPIFEESTPEQILQKFQSDKRIFCILSRKDFAYFSDRKDLRIHILDRHSRFTVHFGTVLNAGYYPGDELLLVSNRP